ncbi:MAG TPA: DUF2254 family protein, partial [Planctomycetota bacterium]|nr:DUF2254 family protein [Planctomycetota bacterium]
MAQDRARSSFRRRWLAPMSALVVVALGLFSVLYLLDHYVTGGVHTGSPTHPLARFFLFDPSTIAGSVSALGGLVAAILGIVITVVSIVVQLSAGRYAGVAGMFLRDRVNMSVLGFYVIACVLGVWLSAGVRSDFVPRASVLAMMLVTTIGLVLMAPYFAYVFWFLEPENIIARIGSDALETARAGGAEADPFEVAALQVRLVSAMEEFTDIASSSISGKDKIIASHAVDALKDLAVDYVRLKPDAAPAWFKIGAGIRQDPAFVAMDPESRLDLEQRRTWVEYKVLKQYLGVFNEALPAMKEINYLIAIDTRYIGEAAAAAGDAELETLALRYMNSYLRATLNAKDVRTAYNLMNQYRLLVEALLRMRRGASAIAAAEHMRYYGHTGLDLKLPFVTETVAYDLATLCQLAQQVASPDEEKLLEVFLSLNRPTPGRDETVLPGVRKAQAKLAAHYLQAGKRERADAIRAAMASEPAHRLRAIRDELLRVDSKDFWEITDRDRNFDYMPPEQRAHLKA